MRHDALTGIAIQGSNPMRDDVPPTEAVYAFDITLHARPSDVGAGDLHTDAWGTWPSLMVPRLALSVPTKPRLVKVSAGIALPYTMLNASAMIASGAGVMVPMLPVAVVGRT